MSWKEIEKASVDPGASSKKNAEKREQAAELARAYNRCFTTEEGKRVLSDLTARFIYNNDTSFASDNVNYEAAYHNGEAGVIKFVINQMQHAEIL
jgi:hypothetical protein